MKRSISVLLLALSLASALAQTTPPALLWTVSGNELAAPGYLYGTVHSKDERAYTYSMHVMGAMAGMHSVAGELDFTEVGKSSMALMNMMMMPNGQRLEDLYSKKQWKEVEAALRKRLSIMAGMVMRMKPFFVMAMLSESSMGTDRPEVLDAYLMEHGRQLDKRVFGLETMKEQVAAVDALPVKEQAKALLAHLRSDGTAEMNELLDAYARQDLDLLLRLMAESPSMPSGLQKSLIVDRNRVMAHRMDSVLRVDGPSMFMVGAGHLPGKEGVVELLRARGYMVDPVDMSASVPWDLDQPSQRIDGWIQYTNDSLGFAVDMPSRPTVSEWGGTLIVRPAKYDGGLVVMVEDLPTGEETTLDQLVEERFFDQDLSITELVHWDLPARLITRTAGELEHASLLMIHSERIYLLMTGARPPIDNLNIIASFRFPTKPE